MNYDTRQTYWQQAELSERARNCLVNEGVDNVEALLRYTDAKLLRVPNLGKVTLAEIKAWIRKLTSAVPTPAMLRLATDEELLAELQRRLKGEP